MTRLCAICVLCSLAVASMAAEDGDLRLLVRPLRVYRASDGVAPQWRFMLLAINGTKETLSLEELQVSVQTSGSPVVRSHRGDELKTLVQGSMQAAPAGLVVIYVMDDGQISRPASAVAVQTLFRTASGGHLQRELSVSLYPRTTNYVRFPLEGRWAAFNTRETQHGAGMGFAFDFVTAADVPLHARPLARPLRPKDFTTWGQPLYAPVSGTVVDCRNDRPDCEPTPGTASFAGSKPKDVSELMGNYIVLQAQYGRYVFMAHLKAGSLQVVTGDTVKEGQPLGEVGNSGNSSGPHLHIEVLDGQPDPRRIISTTFAQSGLPFGFRDVQLEEQGNLRPTGRLVPERGNVLYGAPCWAAGAD